MPPQANPQEYSIQSRLLVGFSILLFLFLGLTGVVLDRAFRESVEAGAAERLQLQIYVLLAAIDEDGGEFFLLEDLREPRFGQMNSGLYGFVSSTQRGELWRSMSALDLQLENPAILMRTVPVGDNRFTRTLAAGGEELFILSYGILWDDGVSEYNFSIMENSDPYYSEIAEFRASLWAWLGGVAVLLLILQVIFLRWGLSPLTRMANDLKMIETGESEQLQSGYPRELQGVTDNLNLLIKSERKQQERYRTTLGDLAHSLKTPLAVISGVTNTIRRQDDDAVDSNTRQKIATVEEQLDRMNQIVSYQLQRAVQSHGTRSLGRQVQIAPVLNKIIQALDKVYVNKQMQCDIDVDKQAVFHGDERDLMELLGNILDNAYKYGHRQLRVVVSTNQTAAAPQLNLVIEDDGPGIDPQQRQFVLQRGARADTLAQGQGIGLAVVTDIVSSYGGLIDVGSSELGGARIQIVFALPTV